LRPAHNSDRIRYALMALIVVQALCALFFVYDSYVDLVSKPAGLRISFHLVVEMIATLSLALAIVFEVLYLRSMMAQSARAEKGMRIASGALQDVIEEYFRDWGLTPAERDVAMFSIKGMSIAEIADLRESREGTIKAHLNGIYRKANVSGRSQLISLLVEDLIGQPLVGATAA